MLFDGVALLLFEPRVCIKCLVRWVCELPRIVLSCAFVCVCVFACCSGLSNVNAILCCFRAIVVRMCDLLARIARGFEFKLVPHACFARGDFDWVSCVVLSVFVNVFSCGMFARTLGC